MIDAEPRHHAGDSQAAPSLFSNAMRQRHHMLFAPLRSMTAINGYALIGAVTTTRVPSHTVRTHRTSRSPWVRTHIGRSVDALRVPCGSRAAQRAMVTGPCRDTSRRSMRRDSELSAVTGQTTIPAGEKISGVGCCLCCAQRHAHLAGNVRPD